MSILSILKKLDFSPPSPKKILIHDNEGSDVLFETIFDKKDCAITYIRGEKYYFSLKILWHFFTSFHHFSFSFVKLRSVRLYPRSVLGQFYRLYLLAYVKSIAPKIVVTFIDDDYLCGWIKRHYSKAIFYAIQNGVRDPVGVGRNLPPKPHAGSVIYLENFFCFGEVEKKVYHQCGHSVERFIQTGSLRGCIAHQKYRGIEKKYDLCIVSEWGDSEMIHGRSRLEFKKAMERFHDLIPRVIQELNLNAILALRDEKNHYEVDFFKKAYRNCNVTYQSRDLKEYSTHRSMYESNLVVGNLTTLLREVFGKGHKVLVCNFTDDDDYDFPVDGMWRLIAPSYGQLKERIKYLLGISAQEFMEKSAAKAKYVMNYPEGQTTAQIIAKELKGALRQ